MIIFVFTGLEYTRQFKKKKHSKIPWLNNGCILQCPLSPVSSDLLCFHWSKLEQNYAHRIPCLICKSKIAFSPFVAVTVLKYALRHINKNTTVHFLWYWILCISLQFKRNFDFDFTDTLMLYQRQRAPCLLYIDLTMIKKKTLVVPGSFTHVLL